MPQGNTKQRDGSERCARRGDHVYSGCYSTRELPGSEQPSVHVAFPLEAGNVQVFCGHECYRMVHSS